MASLSLLNSDSDSFQHASAKCREFVDFLSNHDIGRDIELPQIAVMGDTSSGKSSLLSALSGIELPSNAELTTRCPTRLRMETKKEWSCRVSILWQKKDKQTPSEDVPDVDGIAGAITKAQETIITEEQISQQGKKVEVSKSVVEVKVYGPQYPDLTLIDLPGIVRTVGKDEDKSLVEDIRSLIDDYLKNERCLILAVVPADVDFHNSSILADAQKVDPGTRRTLPVITKADRVDKGAEAPVIRLLLGQSTDEFAYGFHAVKCRGQQDINENKTLEKSLQEEEVFFNSGDHWPKVEDRSLLGVRTLKEKLSQVYMQRVQDEVPSILQEIENMLAGVNKELQLMGEDLQAMQARKAMCRRLEKSMEEFKNMIMGNSASYQFKDIPRDKNGFTHRAQIEAKKSSFSTDIHSAPLCGCDQVQAGDRVTVFEKGGQEVKGKVVKIVVDKQNEINGDRSIFVQPDDLSILEEEWTAKEGISMTDFYELNKGDLLSFDDNGKKFGVFDRKDENDVQEEVYHYFNLNMYTDDEVWADQSEMLLDKIKQNRGQNLQVFLDADLFNSVVSQFVIDQWKPIAMSLLHNIQTIIADFYFEGFDRVCGEYGLVTSGYERFVHFHKQRIEEQLAQQLEKAKMAVDDYIDNELRPATLNHYLNENIQKARQAKLKERLKRMQDKDGKILYSAIKLMLEANERQSIDSYVVEEMSIVLKSYAKVAEKRLIDTIPMTIENKLMKPLFGTNNRDAEDLFDISSDVVLNLLEPSKQLSLKKQNLESKLKGLKEAKLKANQL